MCKCYFVARLKLYTFILLYFLVCIIGCIHLNNNFWNILQYEQFYPCLTNKNHTTMTKFGLICCLKKKKYWTALPWLEIVSFERDCTSIDTLVIMNTCQLSTLEPPLTIMTWYFIYFLSIDSFNHSRKHIVSKYKPVQMYIKKTFNLITK